MIEDRLLKAAYFSPNHLQFPNSWIGHLPFAAWLMEECAPKIFVELGTHSGNSYFSFCQAVAEKNLSTKCYAVDTWEGDHHAGYYGEEVFSHVNSYNQSNYAGFSRLMQMTFDNAKEYFADQSIDLLHIDGLHTYEAVKHDFETWFPKLAIGAVVIFHDTNVREQKFGVWKFWDELKLQYPLNFEFIHSHGLGIIQLGNASSERKLSWITSSSVEQQLLRSYFSALGDRQLNRYELIELHRNLAEKDKEVFDATQTISEYSNQKNSFDQILNEKEEKFRRLLDEHEQLKQQLTIEQQKSQSESERLQFLTATSMKLQNDYESLQDNYANTQVSLERLNKSYQETVRQLQAANETFEKIFQTRSWKTIKLWWKGKHKIVSWLPKNRHLLTNSTDTLPLQEQTSVEIDETSQRLSLLDNTHAGLGNKSAYGQWIYQNEPTQLAFEQQAEFERIFKYRPQISILTPVFNTDASVLKKMVSSVLKQTYSNWELCLVDGGSTKPHIRQILEEYSQQDSRIKAKFLDVNMGISGNSNEAIGIAEGEFFALLDHDDELTPNALYENVLLLNKQPDADIIYSDEDKLDENGVRCDPYFKPDWSPDFFCSSMYTCHLGVYRSSLVREVGGFHSDFDGAQDWDLVLRLIEHTNKIHHIPKVLYHWRMTENSTASNLQTKEYAVSSQIKAVSEHFERLKVDVEVTPGLATNLLRVKRKLSSFPKLSIIIPTRDQVYLLQSCIDSIKNLSTYQNYEIIVVDNNSFMPETLRYFEEISKDEIIRVIKYQKAFNFSAINNFAVDYADGELVLFLNNDTEVISPEWLEAMVEHAIRPEVGAVGARLLYSNDTVQHAGVIIGIGGVAGHSHKYLPKDHPGYFSRAKAIQNCSAVTAACMMVRTEIFKSLGGFNENNLSVAFNDVDFCLRIRQENLLIVYTPYAELYHHESVSRGSDQTLENSPRFKSEVDYMLNCWKKELLYDPYYNPNLTLEREDFSIQYHSNQT